MNTLLIVVGLILIIASIIDIRFKAIPSVFLTSILIVVSFVVLTTPNFNPMQSISFGFIGFLMALFLYEFDFFEGIADIKIMVMIAMVINSTNFLLLFFILVGFFGTAYKGLILWRFKNEKEIAFVPVLLAVYITLWLSGGLIAL